jgi:hypothetical protein
MPYPHALVVALFLGERRYNFVAQWPPELADKSSIAPKDQVAKEVTRALGEISSKIIEGILEGFPEPSAVAGPDGRPIVKLVDSGGNTIAGGLEEVPTPADDGKIDG